MISYPKHLSIVAAIHILFLTYQRWGLGAGGPLGKKYFKTFTKSNKPSDRVSGNSQCFIVVVIFSIKYQKSVLKPFEVNMAPSESPIALVVMFLFYQWK